MKNSLSEAVWLSVIGQAAWLISGCLLLLAASVLFARVIVADHAGPALAIMALLNAAMFYLWGLGSIRYVHKTWRAAAAAVSAKQELG